MGVDLKEDKWMNPHWMGRALKRLALIKERRREDLACSSF
jgi:hypothetical protein